MGEDTRAGFARVDARMDAGFARLDAQASRQDERLRAVELHQARGGAAPR